MVGSIRGAQLDFMLCDCYMKGSNPVNNAFYLTVTLFGSCVVAGGDGRSRVLQQRYLILTLTLANHGKDVTAPTEKGVRTGDGDLNSIFQF